MGFSKAARIFFDCGRGFKPAHKVASLFEYRDLPQQGGGLDVVAHSPLGGLDWQLEMDVVHIGLLKE